MIAMTLFITLWTLIAFITACCFEVTFYNFGGVVMWWAWWPAILLAILIEAIRKFFTKKT